MVGQTCGAVTRPARGRGFHCLRQLYCRRALWAAARLSVAAVCHPIASACMPRGCCICIRCELCSACVGPAGQLASPGLPRTLSLKPRKFTVLPSPRRTPSWLPLGSLVQYRPVTSAQCGHRMRGSDMPDVQSQESRVCRLPVGHGERTPVVWAAPQAMICVTFQVPMLLCCSGLPT